MNKDTAAHIRCLNMGWLLPKDFKEAAKLLPKCVNLQKLHFNLKSMIVPPFKSEHQPEKIAPPFKAILKQMYDQNKVNFFVRVTWASPYPIRNATEEQKVERKAFNKKMKELILAQVMPQPKAIAAGDASATSNNTGTKHKVARKATHNSGRGSA
ncbi:hypothetical protein BDV97DRAFT_364844 [Delphinella strobiligena]|nr:hypothetical protein BDV97DRAFT_364844 [Delphinella strobiligena]